MRQVLLDPHSDFGITEIQFSITHESLASAKLKYYFYKPILKR